MKEGGEAIVEGESGRDRKHGRFERFMHTIKNSHQLTFQGLQSLFRRGDTIAIFYIQASYALLQDRLVRKENVTSLIMHISVWLGG